MILEEILPFNLKPQRILHCRDSSSHWEKNRSTSFSAFLTLFGCNFSLPLCLWLFTHHVSLSYNHSHWPPPASSAAVLSLLQQHRNASSLSMGPFHMKTNRIKSTNGLSKKEITNITWICVGSIKLEFIKLWIENDCGKHEKVVKQQNNQHSNDSSFFLSGHWRGSRQSFDGPS